jgi:signal recognition particle subunit SRP68
MSTTEDTTMQIDSSA